MLSWNGVVRRCWADAYGISAVVAEAVFIEIGLQMLWRYGAVMSAEQPFFYIRRRPVHQLQMIASLLFRLGLDTRLVLALAQ